MNTLATKCDPMFPPRQLEILQLIAHPYSRTQIREKLGINKKTLESHITRIMDKTNMHDYVELIAWAQENGYRSDNTI
jgi:DNA-binding NarL/FixJ family response regulator